MFIPVLASHRAHFLQRQVTHINVTLILAELLNMHPTQEKIRNKGILSSMCLVYEKQYMSLNVIIWSFKIFSLHSQKCTLLLEISHSDVLIKFHGML